MDSSVFIEEIDNLKFQRVEESYVQAVAREAYLDNEIRELCSDSERTLHEYIRVLAECTPIDELNNTKLVNFLQANKLLREITKQDADLVDLYKSRIREKTTLPVFYIDEIATIVVTAFLSGIFSQTAKSLINRLFTSKDISKKDLRKAIDLFLSSPILALLDEQKAGLTVEEITEILNIKPHDVGYFLAKYETQGWVRREKKQKEVWKIKKSRTKIVEEFSNIQGD